MNCPIKMYVVQDDEQVQAAFMNYSEAIGYVFLTFEDINTELEAKACLDLYYLTIDPVTKPLRGSLRRVPPIKF